MNLPEVTPENYYSTEMNMAYMGSTQYKAFCSCEARALAIANGSYKPASSQALMMGSFVDAYFSGEMDQFRAQHPEIFKRDGSLKSDYVKCMDIIQKMESDRLYSLLMSGKKQVIRTGVIAGVPFKIKIDSMIDAKTCETIAREFPEAAGFLGMLDGAIVDQKVMADIEQKWSDEAGARVPFVEAFGYDVQGAIYQAVDGRMLPFILAVGTKQDPPDLAALAIPDDVLQSKLYEIEDKAPWFQAIKQGKIKPHRCEHCEYCRMTRNLNSIIDYREAGQSL